MSWRRAALVPLLLGGLLAGLSGCQEPPRQTLDLTSLFPWTDRGPLLGPSGEIGEPQASAFLSGRWERSQERPDRSLLGKGGFRFFAQGPVATHLFLEGRASAPGEVRFELNGTPLPETFGLDLEWSGIELNLEADQVRQGLNTLYVASLSPTSWRRFQVRPLHMGLDTNGADLGPYAQSGPPPTVSLPFASSLSFPLSLPAEGKLVFDGIEPWTEAGVAPLGEWTLEIVLAGDEPALEKRWTLNTRGAQRLELPASKYPGAALTLSPRLASPPLPGQVGLTLLAPRIESSQPPSLPNPFPTPTRATPSGRRPNVILFLVDTLRADHLGCYGYPRQTSPNFDALAKEGVLFENVTAESSWTKPSTATLLTGQSSLEHGVQDFADILDEERKTLPEIFAENGYQTAGFMSNPLASPIFKFDQGCQTSSYRRLANADQVIGQVTSWLKKREDGTPFFLYIHTMDPHLPYAPPADLVKDWRPKVNVVGDRELAIMSGAVADQEGPDGQGPPLPGLETMIALYDGEILASDRAFGRLVRELKKRDLYDQTIIALVSDHGEEMYERRGFGHVHSLYQELVHVPWILKLPAGQAAGLRVKSNWCHLDTAPTLLGLAGLPSPSSMTGRAFAPESAEQTAPPIFCYVHTGRGAVATHQAERPYSLEAASVRLGDNQLILAEAQLLAKLQPVELYNLSSDPTQKVNLAYQRPATTLYLRQLAREIREKAHGSGAAPQLPAAQVHDSLRGLEYLR